MSRLRFAGAVAALVIAGCGDETGVSEGPVPFKSGNVEQVIPFKDKMTEFAKNKTYTKKSAGEEKPAPEAKSSSTGKTEPAAKTEEKKQ